jgi:hydrogenase nickel incorporation protein HypA/HybF
MHEISLMESVVGLIEDECRRQDFARVRTIRLRVGKLGHAEPDALRFCFKAVAEGTIAEGAQLEIHMVPGAGRCDQCDLTVPLDDRFTPCPICGSPVRLTAGDDLKVAELEVD